MSVIETMRHQQEQGEISKERLEIERERLSIERKRGWREFISLMVSAFALIVSVIALLRPIAVEVRSMPPCEINAPENNSQDDNAENPKSDFVAPVH